MITQKEIHIPKGLRTKLLHNMFSFIFLLPFLMCFNAVCFLVPSLFLLEFSSALNLLHSDNILPAMLLYFICSLNAGMKDS